MEEKGPVGSTDVAEDEEAKFRGRVREEEAPRPKKVKPRIPPEITGAFLAGLTVLLIAKAPLERLMVMIIGKSSGVRPTARATENRSAWSNDLW